MALDFPASPIDGQVFSPAGGPQYIFHPPAWYIVIETATGVPEAPLDGFAYGRMTLAWEKVLKLIGGALSGNLFITKSTPQITLQKAVSGESANIVGSTGSLPRWFMRLGNDEAETGSNKGSFFEVQAANDGGSAMSPACITSERWDLSTRFRDITNMKSFGIEGWVNGYRIVWNCKHDGTNFKNAVAGAAAHAVCSANGLSIYTSPNNPAGTTHVLYENARFRSDGSNEFWGNTYFHATTGNYFYGGVHAFYNAAATVTALIIDPAGYTALYTDLRMQPAQTIYTCLGGTLIYGSNPSAQLFVGASTTYDPYITLDNATSGVNFGYRSADTRLYYGGYSLTPNQYKIYSSLDGPLLMSVRSVLMQGQQTMQVKVNDRWMTVAA